MKAVSCDVTILRRTCKTIELNQPTQTWSCFSFAGSLVCVNSGSSSQLRQDDLIAKLFYFISGHHVEYQTVCDVTFVSDFSFGCCIIIETYYVIQHQSIFRTLIEMILSRL
jgi:hypothetical protein